MADALICLYIFAGTFKVYMSHKILRFIISITDICIKRV